MDSLNLPKGYKFEYVAALGYYCLFSPSGKLIFHDYDYCATLNTLRKYCKIFKEK